MRQGIVFIIVFFLAWVAAAQSRSVWDGVYTAQQANDGAGLYQEKCNSCHGEPETGGDNGPSLAGEGFLDNWKGKSVGDLYTKLSTAMPMDNPGSLTAEEYTNLLSFLFAVNGFPPGEKALTADPAALKSIKIEPKK